MNIQVGEETIKIDDSKVIHFKEGMLGFPENKSFVIFDHECDKAPFKWMQSAENPELGFIVIDPIMVNPKYRPMIPVQELKSLETDDANNIVVLTILTVHNNNPAESTINLNGPILVNENNMQAKQVVLTEGGYSCTHGITINESGEVASAVNG